jgi:hypothetical protein
LEDVKVTNLDMPRIIEGSGSKNNVANELNAKILPDGYRLEVGDMTMRRHLNIDLKFILMHMKIAGLKGRGSLEFIMARKGLMPASLVLNSRSAGAVEKWLTKEGYHYEKSKRFGCPKATGG